MPDTPTVPQISGSPIDQLRAGIDRHAQVVAAAKAAGGGEHALQPPAENDGRS